MRFVNHFIFMTPLAALGSYSHGHSHTGSHSTSALSTTGTRPETPVESGLNSFKKEILIQLVSLLTCQTELTVSPSCI